jgi:hypothetical protein
MYILIIISSITNRWRLNSFYHWDNPTIEPQKSWRKSGNHYVPLHCHLYYNRGSRVEPPARLHQSFAVGKFFLPSWLPRTDTSSNNLLQMRAKFTSYMQTAFSWIVSCSNGVLLLGKTSQHTIPRRLWCFPHFSNADSASRPTTSCAASLNPKK